MNLKDLHYLVAVADLHHFGKAAERCHVSQPTLSMQLKKLEETLGVCIFERNQKQVVTTPEGQAIVDQARVVLRETEELRQIALQLRDPGAGKFRLGAIPTLGPYLLPHILPLFKKTFPKMQFFLHECQTQEILTLLKQGQLDAVLLALPVEGTDAFIERTLFEEPFVLATNKDHPLAKNKTIMLDDLTGQNMLLLGEGHCLKDHALSICQRVDVNRDERFQGTSLETLRHTVAMGQGITLLPELAAPFGQSNTLAITPFADPKPTRTIGLCWRATSSKKALCKDMVTLIRDQFSS